jgi:lysozyme
MFIGDVSSHNNVISWPDYVRDTPAVWSKASQSSGPNAYTNPLFVQQFNGATAAGALVGAYHFGDRTQSPQADAEHFVSTASPSGAFADGRLLPLLDIENTASVTWGDTTWAWIRAFIERYRELTGQRKIIVYASRSFWQTIMVPDRFVDDDVYLMIAAYPGAVDWSKGLNQSGWSHPRLAVWQYTDAAPIAGMQNPGDRSRQVAFTQADLTLGSQPPAPGPDNEGDDDVAVTPVLYLAEADPAVNDGKPLFPHGVWLNELGYYVGLVSDGPNSEQASLLGAYPGTKTVWVSQATLAEWVRISRVGVDTPAPSAVAPATGTTAS